MAQRKEWSLSYINSTILVVTLFSAMPKTLNLRNHLTSQASLQKQKQYDVDSHVLAPTGTAFQDRCEDLDLRYSSPFYKVAYVEFE